VPKPCGFDSASKAQAACNSALHRGAARMRSGRAHREGSIEPFKYHGSELICEARGPDFQTAVIHTAAFGLAPDEP
jgi:hypothetical protein